VDAEARVRVVEDLGRITELAAKAGVRIATEFHGGTLTDTNESALQLLSEVDHANLYTYWQPLMGMNDDTCVEAIGQLSQRLSHLHVYHWDSVKERCPLSVGAERWQKFIQAALEVPGDRYAMLEFVKDDEPENFLRDAATLREWLEI
jgi:sugar phosphate isomerase/epimerase